MKLHFKNRVATDEPVRKNSMANLSKRPLSLGVFLKIILSYLRTSLVMADAQKTSLGFSPYVSFTPVTTRLASSSDLEIIISSYETLSVHLSRRLSMYCMITYCAFLEVLQSRLKLGVDCLQGGEDVSGDLLQVFICMALLTISSRNGSQESTSTTDPDFSPLLTDGLAFLGPDPLLFGELSRSSCKRVFRRAAILKMENL